MDLQKLREVAAQEMAEHNLVGWTFAFADTKRRLGVCKYKPKRIEIAEYYAMHTAEDHVLDTLRHEIAHALAGPGLGHGPAWQAIASKLGAKPVACDTSGEAAVKPGDWQSFCPSCQRTHHRYKRPASFSGYRCTCPAKSPLTYEYKGDPASRPHVPATLAEGHVWFAVCEGCRRVYRKIRQPKAGKWTCRCRHLRVLTWQFGLSPPNIQ